MRKILALSLGLAAFTGCDFYDYADYDYDFEDDWMYTSETAEFARGELLVDSTTFWGDTKGFALGSDGYGALGMVGMVCSFSTTDGFLRSDVDPDDGDEIVMDAVMLGDGGFATVSMDGRQVTVSEFPSEWEGAITVDVTVENTPHDAAITDGHIVTVNHGDTCLVSRASRDGEPVDQIALEGACVSPLATDPANDRVFIATETGTYAIDADGTVSEMGPPASLLAWMPESGLLAKGHADERVVRAWDTSEKWSTAVEGPLVSLDVIKGGRLVAGVSNDAQGALIVLDGETGAVLERVETPAFRRASASPEGGMLAVRGPAALHLVRVVE